MRRTFRATQRTLKVGPQDLRAIFEIAKGDSGGWKASMYSIDQSTDAIPVSSVTLEGSSLKLKVDAVRGTFEGKLSADGESIAGTWTQSSRCRSNCGVQPEKRHGRKIQRRTRIQFVNGRQGRETGGPRWGGSGRPLVLLTGLGDNAHRYRQVRTEVDRHVSRVRDHPARIRRIQRACCPDTPPIGLATTCWR